ncbi:uncharacterized protein RCC_07164 [Ramularia collo-cygni]|uniref:Aminoglycoside phosphotransferase domain-containing protein n=1 Tax=Ramularia collo-cygni TaxID=112498 RepID=A0A2D3UWW6_9PEZI|nr:uncharacterized protein RCC_07164 [Ramularia collo-cygni]CZT21301.1 uncharacterized protein RCC_07164 [Ramularia collo-cygni]
MSHYSNSSTARHGIDSLDPKRYTSSHLLCLCSLLTSTQFSSVENESWLNWTIWHVHRAIAWFQGSTLPRFVGHNRATLQHLGYLLIEYVEDGVMLSSSWNDHCEESEKNKNLYSSIAKIMLDLGGIKQPRIGSWTMNDDGNITLTNRPFHDLTAFWNRHNIPLHLPRGMTYSSADSFLPDLLAYQDVRMEHQPNSILDRDDGVSQLSALVGLRAIFPRLFNARLNRGHFVMNFTDMHQSNIFVDKDWNITRLIIDLEFAYSAPIELVHVPAWLTGRGVDQLYGQNEEPFKLRYDAFVEAVADQEKEKQQSDAFSQRLREDWTSGRYWYVLALDSINAYPSIFNRNLRPQII